MRRQNKAVVVGMAHYHGAHQTGGHAPRRGPYIFGLVIPVYESHIESLGEVLTKEVACARLERLAILHHRLDGIGVDGSGETLVGALDATHHGHSEVFLGKSGIDLQHLLGFILRFLACGVGGMPLLPQEFRGAQEHSGTHLPAHHIGPLVAEDREVTVGGDPVAVCVPDDGLGSRTDDKLLLQARLRIDHHAVAGRVVFQTVMGHNSALLGETLHMLRFLAEE